MSRETSPEPSNLEVAEMRGQVDIITGRLIALVHMTGFSDPKGEDIIYIHARHSDYPRGVVFFLRTKNNNEGHDDLAGYVKALQLVPKDRSFIGGGRYEITKYGLEEGISSSYGPIQETAVKEELDKLIEKYVDSQIDDDHEEDDDSWLEEY